MLIEQDAVLRKMIAGILATEGYKVTDVATARAAAGALTKKKLKPQLVLAPCHDKSVATLIQKLHGKNAHLRLIDLSSKSSEPRELDFLPKAMIHLPKPFALNKLTLSVRNLLDAGAR